MYLVEWSYGLGSALREKVCDAETVRFWVDLARDNGATLIVVTLCGTC